MNRRPKGRSESGRREKNTIYFTLPFCKEARITSEWRNTRLLRAGYSSWLAKAAINYSI